MSSYPPDNYAPHSLGFHAEIARFGGPAPPGTHYIPFNNNSATNPPRVNVGGVTRILIFPGSFNPPHKGHLELLNHVFENSRHSFQLAAAIILVGDDARLLEKMTKLGSDRLFIKQQQRVALWQQAVKDNDKYWVFDNGSAEEWIAFKEDFKQRLGKHGQVEFVVLLGPDVIQRTGGVPGPHHWLCQHTITSNAWRPASFAGPVMPKQLPDHGKWYRVKLGRDQKELLRRDVRDAMRGQSSSMIQQAIDKAIFTAETAWKCQTIPRSPGFLGHVPFDGSPKEDLSSTDLRKLVASLVDQPSSAEQMAESLGGIALSPLLLAQYIEDKQIEKV